MCIIPNHVGYVHTHPIGLVKFPAVMVYVVYTGITVQEIVVQFCCVQELSSWVTLQFLLLLPRRGWSAGSLTTISSVVSSRGVHIYCAIGSTPLSALLLIILLSFLCPSRFTTIHDAQTSFASCSLSG